MVTVAMKLKDTFSLDFPGSSDGKVSAYNAGDLGSIPGSGRSPGEGNPLQDSCLENPGKDRGTWKTTVHVVTKSRTRLSNFTLTFTFPTIQKQNAPMKTFISQNGIK